jgi:hypothetical protein
VHTEEHTTEGEAFAATEIETEPQTSTDRPMRVRGLATRSVISWVTGLHGESGLSRLRDTLDAVTIAHLSGLKPGALQWVSYPAQCRLLEVVDRVFGAGDLAVLHQVGRYSAFRDMPVVARPIARLLSPGAFVDVATRIWPLYHSHGTWRVTRGPSSGRGELTARPQPSAAFCAVVRGWVDGALLFCGASEVVVEEPRCQARGDPTCVLEVRWRG